MNTLFKFFLAGFLNGLMLWIRDLFKEADAAQHLRNAPSH